MITPTVENQLAWPSFLEGIAFCLALNKRQPMGYERIGNFADDTTKRFLVIDGLNPGST